MTTRTSNPSQLHLEQSGGQQNDGGRLMSLRRLLPNLLINAGVPFLIDVLAQPHMSAIDALLLASSVPALYTLVGLVVKRRVDALGLFVVVGLLLSAVFALVFHSPRILLLQGSVLTGTFGIVALISLLFTRPVLFYLVRSITTQNDAQRLASFNAGWAFPQLRAFYRTLSLVWGCAMVGQVLLVAALAFTLPIPLMVGIGPILNFAIILLAVHWSVVYSRKNRPIFDQLRKLRDAGAGAIQ
ncbi:MAG TPA: VC0807 family protein [Ktedonobacteraceae bacterium]|nr:VC0807 family protein [Ktedonobacteraceae bacterium]